MSEIFGLKENKDFVVFVNRRSDGNGFNKTLCDRILDYDANTKKIDLIITADHGSSDEKVIPLFIERNIDFCLTDHHEIPKDNYPKSATVFVNNQREDSTYSNKVSGCFVAFLTMVATYDKYYNHIDMDKFNFLLPFVGLTTISDVMPLDEVINRAMVQFGLNEMNSGRRLLWQVLRREMGIFTNINSTEISFKLAPLINTASRVGCEDVAYNLLTATKEEDIRRNIKRLQKESKVRKLEQKKLNRKSVAQIANLPYKNSVVLLLESDLSVGGIISGQIGETYNKPTVCFIKGENGEATGSARGIVNNVNLVEVFNDIHNEDNSIFVKFGGHKQAAGCSIKYEHIDKFRELFDKYVEKQTKNNPVDNTLYVDDYVDSVDLTPALPLEISRLEPYGKDWDFPVFVSVLRIKYYSIYSNICMFTFITRDGREIKSMYFFNKHSTYTKEELDKYVRNGDTVLVAYKVSLNNFNNKVSLQLNIIDIRSLDGR